MIVSKFNCVNSIINAPILKNGPNGMICSLLFFSKINEVGRPINEPKKIEINAIL